MKTISVDRVTALILILATLVLASCTSTTPTVGPTPTAQTGEKQSAAKPPDKATEVVTSPKPAEKPFSPPVTVKAGVLGLMADAPTYIAIEKGYFLSDGINVETEKFDSGGSQFAPLASGELEVGMGAPGAGFYNGIVRGIPMKLVADAATSPKGFAGNAIMVRKDLIDSGKVKSPKDLKGMNFAVAVPAMFSDYFADTLMRQDGLRFKDLNLVVVPYADMMAAFANKNIDAAVSVEPFNALQADRNIAVRWKGADELFDAQTAMLMFSSKFIKDKPEVAKRYSVSYLKGVRDYVDAFVKKKNRDEVISILIKNTAVKDPALYEKMIPSYMNPDGYTNVRSIQDQIDWYSANGYISERLKAEDIVDHTFLDYANSVLGKYQR